MKKTKITDANGKEFEIDIRDVFDMDADISDSTPSIELEDAEKFPMKDFKVSIVDSEGKEVDMAKLTDDAKTDPTVMPKAIDVLFEATHSGKNRNYYIYHSDSMENDSASWKAPFAKPLLKNHDSYEEPLGRVHDFIYRPSELNTDRDSIDVTYRVTDADAIPKFLDGRYKTMSIGGSVGHMTCSVCGKDIIKDGQFKFCGHWRGETYNGEKCFWNARDIQYKEGSIVNIPADDWAQIKRITLVNDAKDSQDSNAGANADASLLDEMDELTKTTGAEDSKGDKGEKGDPGVPTKTEDKTEGNKEEETLDSVKLQRDTLITDKVNLETEKLESDTKIKDLETQVTSLTTSVATAKEEKNLADREAKESRTKSIQLAVMNKKLMAQRIVDLEVLSNILTDDKKDARLVELISKSAKELSDTMDKLSDSTIKEVRKVAALVKNPSLPNQKDSNVVDDEDEANGKSDANLAKPTMEDFEKSIIDSITKR